jgi:hypothetical protein
VTLLEWFGLGCDDALARGGLDAMNATFSAYLVEREDDEDPRET